MYSSLFLRLLKYFKVCVCSLYSVMSCRLLTCHHKGPALYFIHFPLVYVYNPYTMDYTIYIYYNPMRSVWSMQKYYIKMLRNVLKLYYMIKLIR